MTILPFPYAHERIVGAWPHDTDPPLPDVEPIQFKPEACNDAATGVLFVIVAFVCTVAGAAGGWLLHGLVR